MRFNTIVIMNPDDIKDNSKSVISLDHTTNYYLKFSNSIPPPPPRTNRVLFCNSQRPYTMYYELSDMHDVDFKYFSKLMYGFERYDSSFYNEEFLNETYESYLTRRKKMKNVTKDLINRGRSKFSLMNLAEYYVFDTVVKNVKVKYGKEFLTFNQNQINTITDWIKKYDKNFKNRPKFGNEDQLADCQFIFKIDTDTFAFIQSGNYISKFDLTSTNSKDIDDKVNAIRVYLFGKKYKHYVKELNDLVANVNDQNLYIYNVKGAIDEYNKTEKIDSVGKVLNRRDVNTLFFNDHIMENILDHIDSFLANRSLYESKNLIYKTGILAYGDPGTGKSSLALALATKYNRNLIVIDMTTFDKLNIATLTASINADTDKFIILLEDIDTLFSNLDRDSKDIDRDEKTIINKMLQFLDSSSSPSDVIFLATTNHIELLDQALIRDGRFDLKVNIENIDIDTAIKMVKSFNIEDMTTILDIINECRMMQNKHNVRVVNPAELQNKILAYFKEKIKEKDDVE